VVTFLTELSSNLGRILFYVITRMSLNMGHLGWKTRSQELKIEKKLVNTIVATVLIQISRKFVWKFVLMISRSSWIWVAWGQKLGHNAQIWKIIANTHLSYNFVRMLVWVIARMSLMGQVSDLGTYWPSYLIRESQLFFIVYLWPSAKKFGIGKYL
jgi:hypothetical protein